jgi:hypothetical protein
MRIQGNPTRPQRHREDLCPERDPQAKRTSEPVEAGKPDRCGCKSSADGCHDATSYGEHDECGQGYGSGYESYGFRESVSPFFRSP